MTDGTMTMETETEVCTYTFNFHTQALTLTFPPGFTVNGTIFDANGTTDYVSRRRVRLCLRGHLIEETATPTVINFFEELNRLVPN